MNKSIEVHNLTIRTRKDEKVIVNDLSFNVNRGEVVLLKGRNGTGKSTIIKALMREDSTKYRIDGDIVVNGSIDILKLKKNKDLLKYRSQIGYVPQNDDYSGHYNLEIFDIFSDSINSFSGEKTSFEKIENILNKYDFEQTESNQEKFQMKSNPNKLSGGQQRILSILANIICRPGAFLYIIDEPLNNLDYKNIPIMVEMIRELHRNYPESSFLIVTHNELFDFIDRVVEI